MMSERKNNSQSGLTRREFLFVLGFGAAAVATGAAIGSVSLTPQSPDVNLEAERRAAHDRWLKMLEAQYGNGQNTNSR